MSSIAGKLPEKHQELVRQLVWESMNGDIVHDIVVDSLLNHTENTARTIRESRYGWIRTGLNYITKNPLTSAGLLGSGLIVNKYDMWGTLAKGATYQIAESTLGLHIPLCPLTALGIAGLSYAVYEQVKGPLLDLAESCVKHPIRTAVATYALHHAEIVSPLIQIASAAAVTPVVLKVAAIGITADYIKNCFEERTLAPKSIVEVIKVPQKIVENLRTTKNNFIENATGIATKTKAAATWATNTGSAIKDHVVVNAPVIAAKTKVAATWAMDAATKTGFAIYEYSKTATIVGTAATVAAAAYGFSSLASGLFLATAIPFGFSLAKHNAP